MYRCTASLGQLRARPSLPPCSNGLPSLPPSPHHHRHRPKPKAPSPEPQAL